MDTNLRDDTLKLVRYKVLFVKREHEKAFPEEEDLVSENMDDSAFAAWKVAEFIQNHPNQIAEDDKKYLRIHYQVLERYPREKFKYEENQIKVLEDIRDKIAISGIPLSDPFEEIRYRLQLSKDAFDKWRDGFARCADKLAVDMAKILNDFRPVGQLKPPEITVDELANALKNPKAPFNRVTLDRFTGPALGDLRIYTAPDSPIQERKAPPAYSIWGPAREDGKGGWIQRITGTPTAYISPDDVPTISRLLWEEKIDLTFNAYADDIGIVSWAIFYTNHKNQLRSIGYEMNGKLLWINQLLTPDLKVLQGDVELASVGRKFIPENQFVISIDYLDKADGKTYFNVYAMHMNFDFKKCSAVFAGPILEMANTLEG
jgi:hypothetical protein